MPFKACFLAVVAYTLVLAGLVSCTNDPPTATCTLDSCLIGFAADAVGAFEFCYDYTRPATTLGSPLPTRSAQLHQLHKHRRQAPPPQPSYARDSCESSNLYSACTCLASYTVPAAACSTGQHIANPSFEGLPPGYAANLAPWSNYHVYGDGGCSLNLDSPTEAATDTYYTDDRSLKCYFPNTSTGGRTDMTQIVTNLCPGVQYDLTFRTACIYAGTNASQPSMTLEIFLEGVDSIILEPACSPCLSGDCTTPEFRLWNVSIPLSTTVSYVGYAPNSGVLKVTFAFEETGWYPEYHNGTAAPPAVPVLLDLVYLQARGYAGSTLNPVP